MKKHAIEYDSEHLTPVERAVEAMSERQSCFNCINLQIHPRSGFKGCIEVKREVLVAALSGNYRCEYYIPKRRKHCEQYRS